MPTRQAKRAKNVEITLPHNWTPRGYQLPLCEYLGKGGKRAVAVWHRRAGKDSTALAWTSIAAIQQRVGLYWHMLPTLKQGRKVIWEGMWYDSQDRPHGMLDFWPRELVDQPRIDDMSILLKNGSRWQVVGSDNYDSLIGANPVGVVFSEWAVADPRAWGFIRPILAENGGWAIFIYTPRGRTHGWDMLEQAKHNESWFAQVLTTDDTKAISAEALQADKEAGMSEELFRQEYLCSFDAALQGAYYAHEMTRAQDEGRITKVPYDDFQRVETWWDIGVRDRTAIWFAQTVGQRLHIIDYYENSDEGLSFYVNLIDEWGRPPSRGGKGYRYSQHVFPFDIGQREFTTGQTRLNFLHANGMRAIVAPDASFADGIEIVRMTLGRCWFDEENCRQGINALRSYIKEQIPEERWGSPNVPIYRDKPVHSWASHGADAFRYGSIAHRPRQSLATRREFPQLGIV